MDKRWVTFMGWATALLFGAVSLWVIFEQDIFWQVRAGDELWRTQAWPWVDTWSYSAAGKPWMNIQWLSTLILRGLYSLGAEPALVLGRGVLVVTLFIILASIIRRAAPCPAMQPWALGLLLPLLYVALWPRLQLRSDTFVLFVFALLVRLWQTPGSAARGAFASVGLVGLAANLHAGTAPFVVVGAIAWVLTAMPTRRGMAWAMACGAAFFATPYSYHVLPLLWAHVRYYQHNILTNSDHLPLSHAYLFGRANAGAGLAWLALCAVALMAAAIWAYDRLRARVAWHGAWWALVATCIVFTALSVNRVRAIPYQVIFMLPLLPRALAPRAVWLAATWAPAWTLWVLCVLGLKPLWGLGVHEGLFPVGSTRFVERVQPRRNVMHTFAIGSYLVWHLRDYPLYVDTRETMYWDLQTEVLGQYHSPDITAALVQKYHVNTVIMPIPQTRYVPHSGFEDVLARYLPTQDWALVYFDKITFVAVRRIPEHAALIATHEYRQLRPNLPANAYPLAPERTPERDKLFTTELRRCLQDEPESVYCLIAQAAWLRVTEPAPGAGLALLQKAQNLVNRWGSAQTLTLWVELQAAYKAAQMPQQAADMEARLSGGTLVSD